ncbi:MAG: protein-export chaperone SecB [Gammaproteobacteria bacterium]|nr:protein-export chaperone SecB [Gammaproteobacteria bacterium]
MSDDQPQAGEKIQVQMRLERIYLKDASFESPGAPSIFTEQFRPEFKVDINTAVNSLGDNRHEVVLCVTATANRESKVAYLVEVQQAGIFVIEGAKGPHLQQVIGIACPNTLFPYARECLDSLVVKGGFPALQLAPVNFEALYAQAMQQAELTAQASSDGEIKH